MKTKISKIGVVDNPLVPTASKEKYECGHQNELSPFVNYWVTGELAYDIEVGKSIMLKRDCRNGIKIDGMFVSSVVKEVVKKKSSKYLVYTSNSIYKVEEIDET